MGNQLTPEELKAWRADARLTQEAFGALLGLSRPTIERMETGRAEIPPWAFYARAGWYQLDKDGAARAGVDQTAEDRIRRIVLDVLAEQPEQPAKKVLAAPTRFMVGQLYASLKNFGRTAEIVQVLGEDGQKAYVQVRDGGGQLLFEQTADRFTQFITAWKLRSGPTGRFERGQTYSNKGKPSQTAEVIAAADDGMTATINIYETGGSRLVQKDVQVAYDQFLADWRFVR